MRYRVKDYRVEASESIVWLYFTAPEGVTLTSDPDSEIDGYIQQAIRLVADESADIVFCSSMQKRKYIQWAKVNVNTREVRLAFEIPSGKTVGETDQFTIEMDWGDVPSELSGSDDAHNLAAFFCLPEALPQFTYATDQEVIDIVDDVYNAYFPNN